MALIAPERPSRILPVGNYIGRCYSIINYGTIKWGKNIENIINFGFETPTETLEFKEGEGEKPFSVFASFPFNMREGSYLRNMLESWRGKRFSDEESKKFDISVLIGKPCMVNVIHNAKYANIDSVAPMPKGIDCPPQVNPNFIFDFDDNFVNLEKIKSQNVKDKIMTSLEFAEKNVSKANDVYNKIESAPIEKKDDTDLPF